MSIQIVVRLPDELVVLLDRLIVEGVGRRNGLDADSVINCDNIMTLDSSKIGDQIEVLFDAQETELCAAIVAAVALEAEWVMR